MHNARAPQFVIDVRSHEVLNGYSI